MQTASEIEAVRAAVAEARRAGKRIGLVPTMGALHAGHLSLVKSAALETDFIVTTIFVNPTQFAPGEDFDAYPRPIAEDLNACETAGVHFVFHPSPETMYPPDCTSYVEVEGPTAVLEGAERPSHFRGVTTVVMKLFQIVQADAAFFGQKDFQQQLIIRRMCRDLNVPTRIVTCPTVRDSDGLALSSRNAYLSPDERGHALLLSATLRRGCELLGRGENPSAVMKQMEALLAENTNVVLDYVTIADPQTLAPAAESADELVLLIAARVGQTRLIDNMIWQR